MLKSSKREDDEFHYYRKNEKLLVVDFFTHGIVLKVNKDPIFSAPGFTLTNNNTWEDLRANENV